MNPEWKNREVIAHYRVRYADGEEATIPVRADIKEIHHFILPEDGTDNESSSPNAPLYREFSSYPKAGYATVLFVRSWVNPRPEVPIDSIDVISEGKDTALLLFGVTLGSDRDITVPVPPDERSPMGAIVNPVRRTIVAVPPDSEWRWLHRVAGSDPEESDPDFHQTFASLDFDASGWQSGVDSPDETGGFAYGEKNFTGVDLGTPLVRNEAGKLLGKAAYFRHPFKTSERLEELELRCRFDDGIIVYLDGKEVARENMSMGEPDYDLPAAKTIGGETELVVNRLKLDGVTLDPGEHVLAISVHNPAKPSSDLRLGGVTLLGMATKKSE